MVYDFLRLLVYLAWTVVHDTRQTGEYLRIFTRRQKTTSQKYSKGQWEGKKAWLASDFVFSLAKSEFYSHFVSGYPHPCATYSWCLVSLWKGENFWWFCPWHEMVASLAPYFFLRWNNVVKSGYNDSHRDQIFVSLYPDFTVSGLICTRFVLCTHSYLFCWALESWLPVSAASLLANWLKLLFDRIGVFLFTFLAHMLFTCWIAHMNVQMCAS
jgi:hypothetical protein